MNENDTLTPADIPAQPGASPDAAPVAAAPETSDIEARLQALEARERALDLREREARCRAGLRKRDLPEALIDCLDLSSDERADRTLETLADVFTAALTRRVRDRLGAEPPQAPDAPAPTDPLAAVRAAMGL